MEQRGIHNFGDLNDNFFGIAPDTRYGWYVLELIKFRVIRIARKTIDLI